MGALVDIRDISKVYNPGENEVRALDHVTVRIEEGEYVAIIGQSGSGKSTLMNILGCLDVPTEGKYFLHGNDVSELDDNELSDIRNKEIGFVFQGFNLIANLTALENVELPLIYRGVGRSKRRDLSETALEKVGLGNRMDHRPSEMSGGQQQRVAIARAIAQAPPIILADEPTGNLDSHSTWEIMDILETLHKEGRTVIVITHNNEIASRAERTIKIMDGRIERDSKEPEGEMPDDGNLGGRQSEGKESDGKEPEKLYSITSIGAEPSTEKPLENESDNLSKKASKQPPKPMSEELRRFLAGEMTESELENGADNKTDNKATKTTEGMNHESKEE